MRLEWIKIAEFRNFKQAEINLREKTLIIGANDVGKTNLLYAIRLLLDRSLSEESLAPVETDFHVQLDGTQAPHFEIYIKLTNITEDAVISKMKGHVNQHGETFLKYVGHLSNLSHEIAIGFSEVDLQETESRFYLKYIHFQYIQSSRDLYQYVRSEKKDLIRLAKEARTEKSIGIDKDNEGRIQDNLSIVNEDIGKLSYVADATQSLNTELKKLSYHNADYSVNLEAKSVNFGTFIEQLSLGATTCNRCVGLGGDGRNNQILFALWKVKAERLFDLSSEAIIYCVEEPESHLHPHQQRSLARYLVQGLPGQVLVSTHSPQIASEFSPDCVVRLFENEGATTAASKGCSNCVEESWRALGYRMSILPAETFFSDAVLLVEGPSERILYKEAAKQLSLDLDFHNVSILSVDGIDFEVYIRILNALSIPWVMRTDNDVFRVQKSDPPKWRLAGLNRALRIAGEDEYEPCDHEIGPNDLAKEWEAESKVLNPKGIYVSRFDLENDLLTALPKVLLKFADTKDPIVAVDFLQEKKAVRMGEFVSFYGPELVGLGDDNLLKPLLHAIKLANVRKRVSESRSSRETN